MTTTPPAPASTALQQLESAAAVLFDFNGTLSADEDLLAAIYCDIAAELGIELTPAAYDTEFLGLSDPQIATALAARAAAGERTVTPEQIADRMAEAYLAAVANTPRIAAETCRLVRALAGSGVPLAVVTGTYRRLVTGALQAAGIEQHFAAVIAGEDVTAGKPAPEGFITAARQLGVAAAEQVVVVEDSAPGRQAAEAAGMSVLMVGGSGLTVADIGKALPA